MDSILEKTIGEFFAQDQVQARRVFHGRGQLYPGLEQLCVDWYKPVVLITAYAELEIEEALCALVLEQDKHQQIESIILQMRYERGALCKVLHGQEAAQHVVNEGDLQFEVHLGAQQNTGLFLDTRLLRNWLQDNSQQKNVLNLFAYTCSLSVAALAGGATSVTNVDISKTSIKWGLKNHQLNNQDPRQVKSIPHNIFTSWGRIKQFGRYDLVIIDPPSLQRGSFDLRKNYGAVLKKLSTLCNPGADIIATLNSPFLESDYLSELFAKHAPTCSFIESLPAAPEFADKYPQRALKISHYKMA